MDVRNTPSPYIKDRCRVWCSVNFPTISGAFYLINWDREAYDNNNMHDNSSVPWRITVRTSGIYVVNAGVTFGTSGNGTRSIYLYRTSESIARTYLFPCPTTLTPTNVTSIIEAEAGDYFYLKTLQDSGKDLVLMGKANAYTYLSAVQISG